MKDALWIALGAVGVAITLCAVFAAGFVATVYVDVRFGDPWNYATGCAFFLLFLFVATFMIAWLGGGQEERGKA